MDSSSNAVRYECADDARVRVLFTTELHYRDNAACGASIRFHPKQWRDHDAGFVLMRFRGEHYAVLSSVGHCGLAMIRKYVVETMNDAFEAKWPVPWCTRDDVFRRGEENRIEIEVLDGRMRLSLNGTVLGDVPAPARNDTAMNLLVCGNTNLEAVTVREASVWNPIRDLPYEPPTCWLEVDVTDRLNTASGAPSAPGHHRMYLLMPLSWCNAPGRDGRVKRVLERWYREKSRPVDGESFTLLDVRSAIVFEDDIPESARKACYRLDADGSLNRW